MITNEILEELYQFREAHAKSFNYDVAAMFADWRKRQAASGRHSVNLQSQWQANRESSIQNEV